MSAATAFLWAYGGFAAMSLGMARHHEDVFGGEPSPGRRAALHGLGWLGLLLSVSAAVAGAGWGHGLTLWFGLLTVAGLALIALMPYAPRLAAALGAAGMLAALGITALA